MNLNWNQEKAIGRHVLSYAAGAATAASVMGLISQGDSNTLLSGLNDIANGLEQLTKGVVAIVGVLAPIYAAVKAAHSSSPQEQIKAVVTNLSAPQVTQAADAIADPGGRAKLISAVAEMPEVKGIVATSAVAKATDSDKVVATAGEVKSS